MGDGLPQFQILSRVTGKQVFKAYHNPHEEFTLARRGHRMSLEFFAKIPVKCALADEGQECWKKVLAASPMLQRTPMPNCAPAFAKAKVAKIEDAMVTVKAEISNLKSPKVRLIGGHATCQPAPL